MAFSGTTWVSQCQKKASSGLYGARKDNKRQTHRQSGLVPSGLISNPPPSSPIFTPDALPAGTLSTVLAWDRHRNMLDCIPPWLGCISPWLGKNVHCNYSINIK